MVEKTVDELLQLHQELEEILYEQQGMTFKFKYVNGQFIHTFCAGQLLSKIGLTPCAVIGRQLKDFLPADIAAYKETFYLDAWNGKEDIAYEGEKDGVFYFVSLRPIRRSGQVTEVVASCVDITERKRAEEELRETKELLESLIKNSVDGICVTDMEGKVIRVNRSFEKIYGWQEEELIGKQVPIFPLHMKNDLDVICNQLQTGKKVMNCETIRQRKDGEMIHVCLTVSPIKDAAGRVIALTGITRDISERKRSEDFYRKADKLNVIGQLAAGLAHEIRNPLTSLRGFIQLMQSSGTNKSAYCDIMISEIDRINSIVNEFLIIAKPHATSFRKNDIRIILHNVVTLLEPQAVLNNIQIQLEVEGDFPLVESSEMEIKQVFVNILKNAIEAMPGGGMIRIALVAQTNSILIRFNDEGNGIPDNLIPRLGEPFFTTKEQGTGLGLMMCYKIIADHKGSIMINSVVSEGSTFDITLPLSAGE
ncbi:PAS domain-containing sensor histidine kinase [Paenibacillus mendelii]|uniref:histidine kinase n=1 Tax=Paenibacillus mendelii TaxID=206163 RepID=A0ABV6J262_9BACL|nr:PAS domain S-box protein [Paenibacillus mendelii]MCQ6562886.1 PAS domain S-box protein [Paenibacillus mendelii]